MKTYINKFIIISMLIGFTFSCKDEWVDVAPIATENEASFYLTQSDAEQAVTAVYAQLAYMTTWDRQIQMLLGSIASDDADAGGEDQTDVVIYQDLDRLTHLPTSDVFPNPFGILYKAIMLANKALDKLPNIPNVDPQANPALINQRIAELKFLRALNYFYLTIIFGEVPLVDHVLGASEYQQSRSPMRNLFDFMEKDLKEAIPVLPLTRDAQNIGRATKGAAQALLAKIYLFESSYAKNYPSDPRFANLRERWGEALSTAEEVINSGVYKLVGIDGERYNTFMGPVDGFRFIFTTSGDNSAESVFEVQNINDGMNWLQSRGSSIINWSAARYYYDKNGAKTKTSYWGFNTPREELAKEFETGDPRFFTTIHISRNDPRLTNGTINQPVAKVNDSINMADGWYRINYENSPTGMYQAKFEVAWSEFKGSGTGAWDEAPINTKIIRYADVVLIAAEAAVMAGNNAKALQYINMIRKRARMCGDPGNTVPADLTGTVTLDQVKRERRVELALEGHRFFDLVRWRDAEAKLDGMVRAADGYVIDYIPGKHEFFPIPQREIDLSKGKLKQYEGW
ncbi:MAG: RagB/SusD family nutrient uptake outer membrane protein [Bacteroidales bacterium]|nr:RagB/SusD family nutrient uptake outer membrane protein [Bacteroidales bacterium]